MSTLIVNDAWKKLSAHTAARIGLGRAGAALPTSELLAFGVAHAQARDAVHTALDTTALVQQLTISARQNIKVKSRAATRQQDVQRSDLGRRLHVDSADQLCVFAGKIDIAIVIGDGFSALAAQAHALPLLEALLPQLSEWRCHPIVIAEQCRVALADGIGELIGAKLVLLLLGERPGLSSPDSLGAYLTYAPRLGCRDAERNCVSTIRPEGLSIREAAHKQAWLMRASL